MKIVFTILLFALTVRECDKPGDSQSALSQEHVVLNYNALSRGSYYEVVTTADSITVRKSRDEADIITARTDERDWGKLLALLQTADVDRLPELKAPTDKRLYDGAAHAELIVNIGDREYKTSSFDHGDPPEEIAPLVKTILALAETVEKQ